MGGVLSVFRLFVRYDHTLAPDAYSLLSAVQNRIRPGCDNLQSDTCVSLEALREIGNIPP